MSAYKRLNKQDTYITTYTARKQWAVSGSEYVDYGIENLAGLSGSQVYSLDQSDIFKGQYRKVVYRSISHLYYSGFLKGLPTTNANNSTGSAFENYLQSSFNTSGSRNIGGRVVVFSIPRELIGTHLEPTSITLTPTGVESTSDYIDEGYLSGTDYVEAFTHIYGSDSTITSGDRNFFGEGEDYFATETVADTGFFDTPDSYSATLADDGEGNLYLKFSEPRKYVGNVIYTHGQIIITDDILVGYYTNYMNANITWKSNQPIYTHNYHCRVKESEFNFTLNPTGLGESTVDKYYNDGELYQSATKSTDGTILDNLKVDEFQPYVTTVGLYNDTNELIAVGKLNQPVPKSANTDMTFIVRIDI
jgi:hypothetical protein